MKLTIPKRGFHLMIWTIGIAAAVWWLLPKMPAAQAASPLVQQIERLHDADNRPFVSVPKDKLLLIKFWASWCPLCLSELEHTQQWQHDADFQAATLITVASPQFLSEKNTADFRQWYQSVHDPKPLVLLDEGGSLAKSLNIRVYPSWALLDGQGRVLRIVKGSLKREQALALLKNSDVDLKSVHSNFYRANQKGSTPMNTKTIYLAGGCFWGVEAYFQRIHGVVDAQSGYANGKTANPTYEDVTRRNSGHAETVKIVYDADVIDLKDILRHYLRIVDPTSLNKQGNDRGTQYRTGVYFTDSADQAVIAAALNQAQQQYSAKIVVENQPLEHFYPAEEYHQDYLVKNPNGYCHIDLSRADEPLDASAASPMTHH